MTADDPAVRAEAAEYLLGELLDAYIDACRQGAGVEPLSSPHWHMFLSTYEEADELIPRVQSFLGRPISGQQAPSSVETAPGGVEDEASG